MAALRSDSFSFWGLLQKKPQVVKESKVAREFARRVYKETGGPTPELKQLYAEFLDNKRRSEAGE